MITKVLAPYNAAFVLDGFTLSLGGGYGGGYSFVSNPPLAAGDVQRSLDGAAFANITTLPTVVPAADTSVRINVAAAELAGKMLTIRFIDQTSPRAWDDRVIIIETYGHASSAHPNIGANSSADITAIKAKTDLLTFTGTDVHSTLDGETVTTSSSSTVLLDGDIINPFAETEY